MVKFLSLQYRLGHITVAQVKSLVGKVLTEAECIRIIGNA